MIQIMLGVVAGIGSGVAYYYYWRRKKREELEQKQLQMFIEQIVWDPNSQEYKSASRQEILPLKKTI